MENGEEGSAPASMALGRLMVSSNDGQDVAAWRAAAWCAGAVAGAGQQRAISDSGLLCDMRRRAETHVGRAVGRGGWRNVGAGAEHVAVEVIALMRRRHGGRIKPGLVLRRVRGSTTDRATPGHHLLVRRPFPPRICCGRLLLRTPS